MLENNPLVSVIIPAYNCEKFIRQAIESILNQTYTNIEILISDDASRDNTKRVIDSIHDPRIKCFHNDDNLGYLKTWNKLMSIARGDLITFQDADDYSDFERIEILINELKKDSRLGAVGSNYNRVDENGNLSYTSNFSLEHDEIFLKIPSQFDIIGSGLMIKKEVYKEIGGYNEFFDRMGAEDYYWVFLIMEKFKIINVKDVLYIYRFNENSVSGNISNNPNKINIRTILEHLIYQRRATGSDDLESGKIDELKKKLNYLNKPYNMDSSYYHYHVAKRRFYEGHKKLAIRNLIKAIKLKPFKLNYYRDLFYFIRK
jgi:glycosyltransferase involved in cell wall biosynthesis